MHNPSFYWKEFPILRTERLDLIEITIFHSNDLFKLFSDERVTEFYNLLPFKSNEDAQKAIDWFRDRFTDHLGIRWGIALKGQENIIGTIGFNNIQSGHKANIGYDLQTNYWNNGYMAEALAEIVNFGFQQLGVNRIEAEVMVGNAASEKILTKLGFQKEGVLRDWMFWDGRYFDMVMYSQLRNRQ